MENELAVIAIKGGRYTEAEKMFNSEITTKPTPMSYYGLGLCKLNMILDIGRTTDEVFYCFEKAIALSDENDKGKVEMDVIAICVSNLEQLQNLYSQLDIEKKKQANAAMLGAALTVGFAMIGSSHKSNAFTQISSLAVAGAGVGISLDGLSKLGTIPKMQNEITNLSSQIRSNLQRIIQVNKQLLNDSLTQIEEQKALSTATLSTASTPSNIWTPTFLLCFFLGVFGAHRFYVGKTRTGILMLLTLGGFSIWTIIDLIMIIIGKFTDSNGDLIKRK